MHHLHVRSIKRAQRHLNRAQIQISYHGIDQQYNRAQILKFPPPGASRLTFNPGGDRRLIFLFSSFFLPESLLFGSEEYMLKPI